MTSLLGPEYVEGVAASLVREYLGRKGLRDTLAALDREFPAKNHEVGNITNRNGLLKVLHFGKHMARNKKREVPYRAMIEVMCQLFMNKVEKTPNLATSTSSSEEYLRQTHSNTNSLKRTKKSQDKRSTKVCQNDLVEEDIDDGETFLGAGRAGLFDKDDLDDMAMNYSGTSKGPPSGRASRGMSGPITSNLDDRERDRQRKMMKGRPLSSRRTEEPVSRREEPAVTIKPKDATSIRANAAKDMRAMRPDVADTFSMLKARADYNVGGFHNQRNNPGPLSDVFSSDPKRPLSGARARLSSKDDDAGGAVSHLGILRLGNVHQSLCSRMDHVQQLHDGGAVVADGGLAPGVHDQLVHASRTQGRSDGINNRTACIDVGDNLLFPLR